MTHRTVIVSNHEAYLASATNGGEHCLSIESERSEILARFPHSTVLELSFAELDFANRWCWQTFGPCDGVCTQRDSEYPVCSRRETHSHKGNWTSVWLEKTEYNYGFNE